MDNKRAQAPAITSATVTHSGSELLAYCPDLDGGGHTQDGVALASIHWQSLPAAKDNNTSSASSDWQTGRVDELTQQVEVSNHASTTTQKTRPLTLLLPSHCLLSGSVTLPKAQRRHLHKALPFLIEENLAEDVDQLHIAYHATLQQGELKVYYHAINKQLLNGLLNAFNGPHTALKAVYTETQWLLAQQYSDQQVTGQPEVRHQLWLLDSPQLLDQQWLVSQATEGLNSGQVSRLHRGALPTALQALTAHDAELAIHCQASAELLSEAERTTLNTYPDVELHNSQAQCMPDATTSIATLTRLEQQSDYNLLQGNYRPQSKTSTSRALWPALAAGLGIVFILQTGYWLASGWYFQQQQQQLITQTEELYRQYFPQDKRIINIRRQAQSHLRQNTQGGSAFLPLLTHFANVWREQQSSFSLEQLRYQQSRDQLLITLEADSIASLDTLTRKLSHNGLKANLLSAKEVDKDNAQPPSTAARFQASISLNRGQRLSQR